MWKDKNQPTKSTKTKNVRQLKAKKSGFSHIKTQNIYLVTYEYRFAFLFFGEKNSLLRDFFSSIFLWLKKGNSRVFSFFHSILCVRVCVWNKTINHSVHLPAIFSFFDWLKFETKKKVHILTIPLSLYIVLVWARWIYWIYWFSMKTDSTVQLKYRTSSYFITSFSIESISQYEMYFCRWISFVVNVLQVVVIVSSGNTHREKRQQHQQRQPAAGSYSVSIKCKLKSACVVLSLTSNSYYTYDLHQKVFI